MQGMYRGCIIESVREEALGGWSEVYWSAFSDGYEITSGFGGGTVREMYQVMKMRVDEFLDEFNGDPEEYAKDKEQWILGNF